MLFGTAKRGTTGLAGAGLAGTDRFGAATRAAASFDWSICRFTARETPCSTFVAGAGRGSAVIAMISRANARYSDAPLLDCS